VLGIPFNLCYKACFLDYFFEGPDQVTPTSFVCIKIGAPHNPPLTYALLEGSHHASDPAFLNFRKKLGQFFSRYFGQNI
jgi:hypothetical protein